MGTEPEQNPDKYCWLRERVLRALNKSEYWGYKPHISENEVARKSWKYSEGTVATGKINAGSCCLRNNPISAKTVRVSD